MKNFLEKLKRDGSYYEIAGLLIFVPTFYILGFTVGAGKVYFFEQTDSGRFATFRDCLDWEEDVHHEDQCFQNSNGDNNCCLLYGNRTLPLGTRMSQVGKEYAILSAGSLGFLVGFIYGYER